MSHTTSINNVNVLCCNDILINVCFCLLCRFLLLAGERVLAEGQAGTHEYRWYTLSLTVEVGVGSPLHISLFSYYCF